MLLYEFIFVVLAWLYCSIRTRVASSIKKKDKERIAKDFILKQSYVRPGFVT